VSIWIHPEARNDLESAALYYASKASPRIADEFLAEYQRVIEIIKENQHMGTPLGGGMREYQFTGFPYSLFYAEDESDGPQLYAVAHQSREPGFWSWRL
jgi:toxin ParE1/3/4